MTTKPFILAGFAMLFVLASCNDDDSPAVATPVGNSNAVFDHYTVEMNVAGSNLASSFSEFTTANLCQGKFFSETNEQFINGVSQGQFVTQHYFYQNNLLVKGSMMKTAGIFSMIPRAGLQQ